MRFNSSFLCSTYKGLDLKKAIIIGAGPAGLTAALELLERTDIKPIIIEKDNMVGGIARTVNYKGNRIDIGGHRFFSKSDRVMDWWLKILPLEPGKEHDIEITYHNKTKTIHQDEDVEISDPNNIMLVRRRKSRIYYRRKFFNYPISLSAQTLKKLGFFGAQLELLKCVHTTFNGTRTMVDCIFLKLNCGANPILAIFYSI